MLAFPGGAILPLVSRTLIRTVLPGRTSAVRALTLAAVFALVLCAGVPAARAAGTVSTVSPRPLGMGGAFTAIEDEIAGVTWNPAGLLPPECREGNNFRIHVNILGAAVIAQEIGLLTGVETEPYASLPGLEKLGIAIGSLIKSATYRRGGLSVGFVLLEERLGAEQLSGSSGLADAGNLLDAYYSSVAAAFRLDPRVSLGLTVTVFAGWDEAGNREYGLGRTYGATLKPNDRLTASFTFYDCDNEFADYRIDVEGLAPRTVNGGIVFQATDALRLSFDLRDLAEEHAVTALEPHAGAEWTVWRQLSLRLGAYREGSSDSDVLTMGLGAIPMAGCWEAGGAPSDALVLNYAVLLTNGEGPRHLLSALLHF